MRREKNAAVIHHGNWLSNQWEHSIQSLKSKPIHRRGNLLLTNEHLDAISDAICDINRSGEYHSLLLVGPRAA